MTEHSDLDFDNPEALVGVPLTKAQKRQAIAQARNYVDQLRDVIRILEQDAEEGDADDGAGHRDAPGDSLSA